jgi:hypothetical protein
VFGLIVEVGALRQNLARSTSDSRAQEELSQRFAAELASSRVEASGLEASLTAVRREVDGRIASIDARRHAEISEFRVELTTHASEAAVSQARREVEVSRLRSELSSAALQLEGSASRCPAVHGCRGGGREVGAERGSLKAAAAVPTRLPDSWCSFCRRAASQR